jgi:hypothetical protein
LILKLLKESDYQQLVRVSELPEPLQVCAPGVQTKTEKQGNMAQGHHTATILSSPHWMVPTFVLVLNVTSVPAAKDLLQMPSSPKVALDSGLPNFLS